MALLSATGITTAAGGIDQGALLSGLYLALTMVGGVLSLPFAPKVAHRLGTRRTVLNLRIVVAATWLIAGAMVIAGVPALWVIMVSAPIVGAGGGIAGALSNIVYRAYLANADFAAVAARMTLWRGIGFAIGALAGGLFLNTGSEGIGLVVAGLVTVPLLVVLTRRTPDFPLPTPERPKAPWAEIRGAFAESPTLRRTVILSVSMALFAAPAMSLAVPIAQSLRHAPLYQGAGILLFGFAIGEMLSPAVVSRLPHGGRPIINAARTGTAVGVLLILLGLVSGFFSFSTEVGMWAIGAIGIGAFRFASRAFGQASVAGSRGHDKAASSLAAASFSARVAGPIGVLGWSIGLGSIGAQATAVVAGLAMAAATTFVFVRVARDPQDSAGAAR